MAWTREQMAARAAKELQNGDSGHALRFQASARYTF